MEVKEDEGIVDLISGEGTWDLSEGRLRSTITSSSNVDIAQVGTSVTVDVLELTQELFRYRVKGQPPVEERRPE